VEPPVGQNLIVVTRDGYVDDGLYSGSGVFSGLIDEQDPVRFWTNFPKASAFEGSCPLAHWQTGSPSDFGTYVAYVQVEGSSKQMLRELMWDGEEWFLFGARLGDTATVVCWCERPDAE
jgi:hypothetical protein